MRILPILLISISGYIPADGGYQPYQTDRQTDRAHGPWSQPPRSHIPFHV
ncbi:hypothetical protein KC19_9G011400 [Ceratodon purpureus]|uniref:Uncharacterized protein n=1 Tax=Ceratodon purpureus TaxID=3225 RepID=A0A8T0GRE2_CERPU|nr:hypothetical protein KC19_9G011400 [Ceratodon purpureus]